MTNQKEAIPQLYVSYNVGGKHANVFQTEVNAAEIPQHVPVMPLDESDDFIYHIPTFIRSADGTFLKVTGIILEPLGKGETPPKFDEEEAFKYLGMEYETVEAPKPKKPKTKAHG